MYYTIKQLYWKLTVEILNISPLRGSPKCKNIANVSHFCQYVNIFKIHFVIGFQGFYCDLYHLS